jgi:hypothetical protein
MSRLDRNWWYRSSEPSQYTSVLYTEASKSVYGEVREEDAELADGDTPVYTPVSDDEDDDDSAGLPASGV